VIPFLWLLVLLTDSPSDLIGAVTRIFATEGVAGFYSGLGITLMREIPFAFIQFPIYEGLKRVACTSFRREPTSYEAALCGSVAGGIAAFITTPLDVAKTRMMLGKDVNGVPYKGAIDTLVRLQNEGSGALFKGVTPRVIWISIGGFVFFGVYEAARGFIRPVLVRR
jgi:solute carrier family 25 S-adenosylmethionine transporter 26